MFSVTEMRGQSSLLHKSGSIEFNTEYCTRKKPAWLVLNSHLIKTCIVFLPISRPDIKQVKCQP